MTIKHLVLSGGGPSMIQTLGSLEHLEKNHVILRENIETIYGTSAGAMVGVLYAMNFDWDTINDYIIKRPWKEVFSVKIQNIFDAYTKKGIFNHETIEKCFKPLLNAKDLDLTIDLKDFYEYSKIELHFFAFEINQFHLVDISYKSHPQLSLLTAIQMTCALPVLVSPVCIDDKCFIDGGVQCNYPLKYCLEAHSEQEEILGFRNQYESSERNTAITGESTLLDFIMNFLFKLIFSISRDHLQPTISSEIICNTKFLSIEYFKKTFVEEGSRRELFQQGIEAAELFIGARSSSMKSSLEEEVNLDDDDDHDDNEIFETR
jgi:predicted acylesterase/phospholipase RssA